VGDLPVNGPTHSSYAEVAARLVVEHGFVPSAKPMLSNALTRKHFVESAALPDQVVEIAIAGNTKANIRTKKPRIFTV
jgi:hypothetical protein